MGDPEPEGQHGSTVVNNLNFGKVKYFPYLGWSLFPDGDTYLLSYTFYKVVFSYLV